MSSVNSDRSGLIIDVWSIPLVIPPPSETLYRHTLSADEICRADRFLHAHHRQRFIAGRCRLRSILGLYLQCNPADIVFAYENLGKPRIAEPHSDIKMSFNFSNSAELGLLAVAEEELELGIDVEWPRSLSDLLGLAKRYFHPQEIAAIECATGDERERTFFRCWTRKEAYLKAVGSGLTFPLHKVLVTVDASALPEIVSVDGSRDEGAEWQLHHWEGMAPYLGAMAYRSNVRATVRPFAWSSNEESQMAGRSESS
jgi:4'-phosphopantetheinyl transferase